MRLVALCLLLVPPLVAAENTLTAEERRQGWHLLFDGHSLEGWMWSIDPHPPAPSWKAEDGTLHAVPKSATDVYLLTRDSFRDYELSFDWKIDTAGNSGIKYRFQGYFMQASRSVEPQPGPGNRIEPVGLEYQITDDFKNPDALSTPKHSSGAIYEYFAPEKSEPARAGIWHTGRIVVRGIHVEHWLDGHRVVNVDLDSEEARAGFAASKRGSAQSLRAQQRRESPIALQIHDGEVWFRNLKIRPLP